MTSSNKYYGRVAIGALIVLPFVNWWLVHARHIQCAWLSTMFFMLVFCLLAGKQLTGRWPGLLIDERNVISLSRFQMVLWTVIVVSAFIAAAFYNVFNNVDSPLAIAIPNHVWLAMGISTASLVGTPLILAQKSEKPVNTDDATAAKKQFDPPAAAQTPAPADGQASPPKPSDAITNKGPVVYNKLPTDAAWTDMVTGDELSNGAHLDLAKVQMLFFTIAIIVSYVYAIWRLFGFAPADGLTAFPDLDESAIALLGISHSGYLVNKAVPRSLATADTQ